VYVYVGSSDVLKEENYSKSAVKTLTHTQLSSKPVILNLIPIGTHPDPGFHGKNPSEHSPVSWIAENDAILIGSCPHSWLFTRVCGVVHHGGAGTTAAGLRAGIYMYSYMYICIYMYVYIGTYIYIFIIYVQYTI
jgi:hypothetical protein